jgi:signal transduction histidine kinase
MIRRHPLFAGLPDAELDELVSLATPVSIAPGELLMAEGSPGGSLYIILGGRFRVTTRSGQQEIQIAECGAGDVLGEISLLDRSPRTASVWATEDSQLIMIDRDTFEKVLADSPTAMMAILRTITLRLRNTEASLRQSEKMAALGTLAAGLAHELNNPAAAARRAATQAKDVTAALVQATAELNALQLDSSQLAAVAVRNQGRGHRSGTVSDLDPVARGDRENDLQEWLEDRGVDAAWELAPTLASAGWDVDQLARATAAFDAKQLGPVVRWLGVGSTAYDLLYVVAHASERISEIVKAVKTYSYLDQAPVQNVDLREGLENTLVMLRHKLRAGVRVVRDYAPDLPPIEAHGSELNQVWTNLIDNAVDAMKGEGELRLRTGQTDHGTVIVEIGDSGPGIPSEIQSRVFEPFFTTKPPGSGTGLGLHISYNIVVQKHRGTITVESRPGETRFRVELPLRLKLA